jgi:hypothetical protein
VRKAESLWGAEVLGSQLEDLSWSELQELLVLKSGKDAVCTPPHDIMDMPIKPTFPRARAQKFSWT